MESVAGARGLKLWLCERLRAAIASQSVLRGSYEVANT